MSKDNIIQSENIDRQFTTTIIKYCGSGMNEVYLVKPDNTKILCGESYTTEELVDLVMKARKHVSR